MGVTQHHFVPKKGADSDRDVAWQDVDSLAMILLLLVDCTIASSSMFILPKLYIQVDADCFSS